jgi:hypothetical protein
LGSEFTIRGVERMRVSYKIIGFTTFIFTVWLAYLLPWVVDGVIAAGFLIGWAVSKVLEELS